MTFSTAFGNDNDGFKRAPSTVRSTIHSTSRPVDQKRIRGLLRITRKAKVIKIKTGFYVVRIAKCWRRNLNVQSHSVNPAL